MLLIFKQFLKVNYSDVTVGNSAICTSPYVRSGVYIKTPQNKDQSALCLWFSVTGYITVIVNESRVRHNLLFWQHKLRGRPPVLRAGVYRRCRPCSFLYFPFCAITIRFLNLNQQVGLNCHKLTIIWSGNTLHSIP
jgi:hypothetical protein